MARKTKLTPFLLGKITGLLRDGVTINTACRAVGIDDSTYFRWLNDNRPIYCEFSEAVERAQAECETCCVKIIRDAAEKGNWFAAAWWLERRFPGRWGKHDRICLEASRMSDAELDAAIAAIEREQNEE